ncbi:undecaprenyl-diphosphate phosphatase [Rhizomonospora bruguierae]|uniref:undecaprenyl-diphosphate phosphatase n=1 Tax=Rhizomonospora bruguierae TaxID=1581705 RepID=UPI001BCC004B|nr:undecaprenyl-diphosphate phosphatase [Micromonospora sp. NBRC 107566]
MSWIECIVLGIVQGLTEFLPVSSSAHLRITGEVFFHHDAGASFTAVTQLGTEAAVLIYFAKDIWRITKTWIVGLWDRPTRQTFDYRLAWYVIIGTIPIGLLGYLLKDQVRHAARNLWITATVLIVFALVLAFAELLGRKSRPLEQARFGDGITMGLGQCLALIPGVSRSGATISAGLFLGLRREAATRVSFLLAIPAVLASGIFSLPDVFLPGTPEAPAPSPAQMAVATVIAFVLGYASIAWLLNWVARHTIYVFVFYRIALGGVLLGALTTGALAAT